MGRDASPPRAPRSSTRATARTKRSRSASRSPSASSRSSRSRSRSRSRERASRRRRSRSRSTSRSQRHASRRSRRSRSRSASHGRRSTRHRERRHHSSRHRDRGRDHDGEHDRHTGSSSSRKRSRRERSRSTERQHRHRRRDSSPHKEKRTHDRRQRPRRGSDAASSQNGTVKVTTTMATANPSSPPLPTQSTPTTGDQPNSQPVDVVVDSEGQEKDDTPVSQESIATSMATTTASSQSDTESTTKQVAVGEVSPTNEKTEIGVETIRSTTKTASTTGKVDVKSIKMDILKALADARSTIAGIKGAAPTAAIASASAVQPASPAQVDTPKKPQDDEEPPLSSVNETEQRPGSLAISAKPEHGSPLKEQVSSADVDEFDMFSAAELHGAGLPLSPAAGPATMVLGTAVQSNYDDADGYYKPNIGEILNSKYRVMGNVGKGVFSTVLRCQRLSSMSEDPDVVAIKLIRNNEIMREASQTEIKILTHLSERDPRDKKHCVRLLERFEHRNHVALVFESMQMNVREAMKKFGGKGGISIQAVRIFSKHLLVALGHLEASGIVHADIKPDNVLLDEKQTMIKLCDFGSAFEANEGKHDATPYLVSRFYRAPEIVLGLPYDKAVDMWSVGCCLYEMFTGKVMFPGATNNEMLKLFMELKGKVPNKIIKKHRQAYIEQFQMEPHFTEDNKFCSHEIDRVTGKPVLRLMEAMKTRFDLGSALLSAKSSTDDRKQVLELRNLLERMFTLDAAKRITPKEALAHPFVKTEGKQAV